MKVKELIAILNGFKPEAIILFARDEEGNTYHRRADVILTHFSEGDGPEDLVSSDSGDSPVVIYPLDGADDFE